MIGQMKVVQTCKAKTRQLDVHARSIVQTPPETLNEIAWVKPICFATAPHQLNQVRARKTGPATSLWVHLRDIV